LAPRVQPSSEQAFGEPKGRSILYTVNRAGGFEVSTSATKCRISAPLVRCHFLLIPPTQQHADCGVPANIVALAHF